MPTESSLSVGGQSSEASKASLDEDDLYDVLLANFAMQRGQYATAERHFSHFIRATGDPEYTKNAVRYMARKGQYAQATVLARLLLEVSDNEQLAHQWILMFALKANDKTSVMKELEWALDTLAAEKKDTVTNELYGLLQRNTTAVFAKRLMKDLQTHYANDASALRLVAVILFRYKDQEAADIALNEALKLKPNELKNILLKAQFHEKQQQKRQAIDYLQRALQKQPNHYAVRNHYARLLLQENRFQEAKEQYLKLSEMGSPKEQASALYTLSLIMIDMRQRDEARRYLKQLSKKKFYQGEAHYYLGVVDKMDDRVDAAIAHFKQVGRGTYWLDAQYHAGRLMAESIGVPEALDFLQQLQPEEDQEFKTLWQLKARLLMDAGRQDEAKEVFEQALKRFPDDVDVLYAKAVLLADAEGEDVSDVETIFLQILKQQPDYAHALNALGYTLADRTRRYEEALGYIQRALELLPKSFAVMDSMGWVQYRLGHYDEALKYLKQAFDGKMDPEIASHLGVVFWETGDMDQAREVWGKALLEFPKNERLIKAIEKYDY